MEESAAKVQQLETLLWDVDGGLTGAGGAEMEAALRATEELLEDLRDDAQLLTGNNHPHTHTHTPVTSLTRTTTNRAGDEAAGPPVVHQPQSADQRAGRPEHRRRCRRRPAAAAAVPDQGGGGPGPDGGHETQAGEGRG